MRRLVAGIILCCIIAGIGGFLCGRISMGYTQARIGNDITIEEVIESSRVAANNHIILSELPTKDGREFHLYWAKVHLACADYIEEAYGEWDFTKK